MKFHENPSDGSYTVLRERTDRHTNKYDETSSHFPQLICESA